MKALVVDDEALVRSELVYALQRVAGDWEVKEASGAREALAMLTDNPFDVVFFDIRMPGMSGLEAMRAIEALQHRPWVVFVTADEDYAVEAFELAAFDYLLKPVTEQRLAMTLKRLRARMNPAPARTAATGRLPVEAEGRTLLVRVEDVRYVVAQGHYVSVALFEKQHRFRGTLAEAAEKLQEFGFLRVHRAFLVNPQHVVEVRPFLAGAYTIRIDDHAKSQVPVSRHYARGVKTAFDL